MYPLHPSFNVIYDFLDVYKNPFTPTQNANDE
jgi:hypothetical protein